MNRAIYPQANSPELIFGLVAGLASGDDAQLLRNKLFMGKSRQYSYYLNAAKYLGLVSSDRSGANLTQRGRQVSRQPFDLGGAYNLANAMIDIEIVRKLVQLISNHVDPDIPYCQHLLSEEANNLGVSYSPETLHRRAQTFVRWALFTSQHLNEGEDRWI